MPESLVEADEPVDNFVLAKWRFAKHAAIYYHQADAQGNLGAYFRYINRLYEDRWPTDVSDDALAKVSISMVLATRPSVPLPDPTQRCEHKSRLPQLTPSALSLLDAGSVY